MAERRAVPSDLFPFVLAFLRENRFEGAARAFAKEAAAVSLAGAGEGRVREWSVMCSVMCSVSLRLRLTRVRVSPQKEQDPNAASLLDIFSYWVK